jgi:hypothetical protein
MQGIYLDELKFPISRSVLGEVNKKAKILLETGRVEKLSKGRGLAWKNFNISVVRRLRKLGLISIEREKERSYIKPLVRSILLKVGKGNRIDNIYDISNAHKIVRTLRGKSKTRQNFDKRLKYEVPDSVEIVFPNWTDEI